MIKNNRRDFIKKSLVAASGITLGTSGLLSACSVENKVAGKKPNVLLIMCDDMGFSDIGCYGGEISTPNLDKLASEGMKFTQFYNAARCCPTRASLLTGLYPHQAGLGNMVQKEPSEKGPYQGFLSENGVTIAEVLKSNGYKTYMSGKWHVGENRPHWPVDRGFDKYYGLISGAMNYFDISKSKKKGLKRVFAKDGELFDPPKNNFYSTDAFTDEAISQLTDHAQSEKPFFMYLAYNAPHWPLHAYPEDIDKYRGKYMKGWAELRRERYNRQLEMGLISPDWKLSEQDSEAYEWEEVADKERMDLKMAIYAAQIERMDTNIGRVIEKLKNMNQLDETLILFLSDNGGCAETHPLGNDGMGGWNGELGTVNSYSTYGRSWSNASNTPFRLHKKNTHEGGIATPLIARFPREVKPGSKSDQMGHVIDIMATVLDISDSNYPTKFKGNSITPLEGKSLMPLLKGENKNIHDKIYWEHIGNRAIRKGNWKLVSVDDGNWELYDMKSDRTETNNLINQYPDLAAELKHDYSLWAEKCGV
ncbi:MAG: arylsulfatase [Melioribacteraceae bacterium]|nr:arylsulfatase [Melioribacteraceae bacterium]